jgi:DNA-binding response OmpR family regulator
LRLFVSSFAQPRLESLLLCSDDSVVRVLRRVLTDLEIGVEHCTDIDSAIQKLTRQRFEAVIVDCTTKEIAAKILKGAHSAPANKRAIAVAIIDGQSALKSAFELGAHFVLFKPISLERTKASFRSVRALMKRERRRHSRIPVELSVKLHSQNPPRTIELVTADLSENGIAIKSRSKLPATFRVRFTLPGVVNEIDCRGEVAWQGNDLQGIRFCDLPDDQSSRIKSWIFRHLQGGDADDPPVNCRLTDLSLNACYLETESPFPIRTRLQIVMKVRDMEIPVEGMVRVMHPGAGIGVQFTRQNAEEKKRVEAFIHTLVNNEGAVPEIEVRPDAIDNSPTAFSAAHIDAEHDPLLSLFHVGNELPPDEFHAELRKQRGATEQVAT